MPVLALLKRSTVGIGVDLGTSSLKVVQLTRTGAAVSLVTYGVANQRNLLVENAGPDAVGQEAVVLRELLRRTGVAKGTVVAALPVLSLFSTVLQLPEMSGREMESAVTFAAKSYVPSPLTEVVLGWTQIGEPREVTAPRAAPGPFASSAAVPPAVPAVPVAGKSPPVRKIQEVFLTAAPRELVQRYTSLFARLDIPIGALEVESFPLVRSLLAGEKQPALLVDLGDRTTSFSIVDAGYVRVNQAMDVGGNNLTAAIARAVSTSEEEAEQRKRREGVSAGPDQPVTKAMQPVLTEIIQRGEALRRLYERKQQRPLGKMVLIGGGARLPGLTTHWSSVAGVPVEVGNPWRGITAPAALAGRLRELGPSFAVAVGLALQPFERAA